MWSIEEGWLSVARRCPSPNFDERQNLDDISLLVVHCISLPPKEFGGPWIDHLFTNTLDATKHPYFAEINHLKVSAHLLIRRDGSCVQYVPFHQRAWHAGVSSFDGREQCNDFSIGIELEGFDTIPYETEQYDTLAQVTELLLATYPNMQANRIAGHDAIAPGRKTDPGPAFDWSHYRTLLTVNDNKPL